MRLRLNLVAAAAALSVAVLSGCDSSSTAGGTPPPHTSHTMSPGGSMSPSDSSAMGNMVMIVIKNFTYMGPTSVKPGAMVMVTNKDSETHTLTSDQSGLFAVNVGASGGSAMFNAPTKPGSYSYHCDFHADMHGTLVVK
ncbi:MAG: cupredoxin domain-containing protein [Nocardioidaceae bacterium]